MGGKFTHNPHHNLHHNPHHNSIPRDSCERLLASVRGYANCALKLMKFAFKMMNLVLKIRGYAKRGDFSVDRSAK